MITITAIITFLILSFIIYKAKLFSDHYWKSKYSIAVFSIKVLVGFGLSWIYSNHYTVRSEADTYKYFDDAKLLNQVYDKNPSHYFQMLLGIEDANNIVFADYMKYSNNWRKQTDDYLQERSIKDFNIFDDHHFITKINSLLLFVSFGSYETHLILFVFLSFIGLRLINKTIDHFLFEYSFFRHAALYLFPTILVWTSIPIKESLLVLGIGLFMWNLQKAFYTFKLKYFLYVLFAILLIMKTKYFMILFLLPVIPFILSRKKKNHIISVAAISLCLIIFSIFQSDNLFIKQNENKQIIENYPDATTVSPPNQFSDNFAKNSKSLFHALYNTYIQPLFISSSKMLVNLAKVENVLLILLFTISFFKQRQYRWDMLTLSIGALILSAIIIGLSTLIVGNIHRYKLVPMLFILAYVAQYFPFQYKVDLLKR